MMWKWLMTCIVIGVVSIRIATSDGEITKTETIDDQQYPNITADLQATVKLKCNVTKENDTNSTQIEYINNISNVDQGCGDSLRRFYLDDVANESTRTIIIIIISCVSAIVFILLVIATICVIKKRQIQTEPIVDKIALKKVVVIKPTIDEINNSTILPAPKIRIKKQSNALQCLPESSTSLNKVVTIEEYDIPFDSKFEFPRNKLAIDKMISEGMFSRIYVANAHIHQRKLKRMVAVKTLKQKYTDADLMNLICEMELMKIIGTHENIISLIGCCSQTMPFYMIIEYAALGNLRDYLRSELEASTLDNREDCFTAIELTEFVVQVAEGMKYLTMKKVP